MDIYQRFNQYTVVSLHYKHSYPFSQMNAYSG